MQRSYNISFTKFRVYSKITRKKNTKKLENITYTQEKKQSVDNSSKMEQMLELAEKNRKSSIITILMDIKENTF